jgi:hypothetical protein
VVTRVEVVVSTNTTISESGEVWESTLIVSNSLVSKVEVVTIGATVLGIITENVETFTVIGSVIVHVIKGRIVT